MSKRFPQFTWPGNNRFYCSKWDSHSLNQAVYDWTQVRADRGCRSSCHSLDWYSRLDYLRVALAGPLLHPRRPCFRWASLSSLPGTAILVITGVFLSLAQCTDPGVIPRDWVQQILSNQPNPQDFLFDPDPKRDLENKVKRFEERPQELKENTKERDAPNSRGQLSSYHRIEDSLNANTSLGSESSPHQN